MANICGHFFRKQCVISKNGKLLNNIADKACVDKVAKSMHNLKKKSPVIPIKSSLQKNGDIFYIVVQIKDLRVQLSIEHATL